MLSSGRKPSGEPVDAGDVVLYETMRGGSYHTENRKRAVTIAVGQWHNAEVRCENARVRFLLDGVEVNFIQADRPLVFHPGFTSSGADIRIKNVRSASIPVSLTTGSAPKKAGLHVPISPK